MIFWKKCSLIRPKGPPRVLVMGGETKDYTATTGQNTTHTKDYTGTWSNQYKLLKRGSNKADDAQNPENIGHFEQGETHIWCPLLLLATHIPSKH
uniref:Uncharacterized protein n=1 Tax=Kalanchoe fedtschenkoi TaxID=63787 RepID=A0A7N0V9X1_KALFE